MADETSMKSVFSRPESLTDRETHYCSGCQHGIIHRLVAEAVDELAIREKVIGVAPVGCAVLAYNYFNFDMMEAPHGRAPAVATGLKRSLPDSAVFCYQGDGDLAAIGTAEIIHAAVRGENLTSIFVNNANYGMTGGQMAPTTILGQKTRTSPRGRKPEVEGYPMKIAEMMGNIEGVAFSRRVALTDIRLIKQAGSAIKKAFSNQLEGKGFSLVEVLSTCPTNWNMEPLEAVRWVEEEMTGHFPLGIFKDIDGGGID